MIDASYIQVHPHGAGARGGTQAMGRTKGGLNSKLHLAVDAHGMPVRLVRTEGAVANGTRAKPLTADLAAQYLLADRGYDTNAIVAGAMAQGIELPHSSPFARFEHWPSGPDYFDDTP